MKSTVNSYLIFLSLSLSVLISCNKPTENWAVPEELTGTWKTEEIDVKVRTQHGILNYKHTPGRAKISISIKKDKSVSGSIGMYKFRNGRLTRNGEYKIVCDSVGKIFPNDPLEAKQVSFWISGIHQNTMKVELRYTENGAKYPMAGMELHKVND